MNAKSTNEEILGKSPDSLTSAEIFPVFKNYFTVWKKKEVRARVQSALCLEVA